MLKKGVRAGYSSNFSAEMRVITDGQCQRMYEAALEILESVGVEVLSEAGLELLKDAGCYIDGNIVKIPSFLVKKAIATAPSRIVVADRFGNRTMSLENKNSYFGPGPTTTHIIDVETGERRLVKKDDVRRTAILSDALENIDFVMSLATLSDVDERLSDIHEFHAMIENTTKPIVAWANNKENVQDIIDMCVEIRGSLENLQKDPYLIMYCEPVSPLLHPADSIDKVLLLAENRIPLIYTAGIQYGGTGPITIAGTIALGLADCFVGLVLSQLKNEGAPFIAGVGTCQLDMKTLQCIYGCPEMVMGDMIANQVCKYLGLPVFAKAGASDSKVFDEQSATDAAFQILTTALCGANLIHDVGFMEMGLSASYEQLVLGDEIIAMTRMLVAGVEINDFTLALDVIKEVGPGGDFLRSKHTLKNFKSHSSFPICYDHHAYFDWKKLGEKTMKERVNERARKLLNEHKPPKLSAEVADKIAAIVQRSEDRLK